MFIRLKAKTIAYDDTHDDNHIFLHLVVKDPAVKNDRADAARERKKSPAAVHYSAAVNVASNTSASRLAYVIKEYGESMFDAISELPWGLASEGVVFDYWKNTKLDRKEFVKADTHFIPDNDFGNRLIHLTNRMIHDKDSFIVVFGKMWGPEYRKEYVFGFSPAQGVHDIHCNQSSPAGSRWQEKDAPGMDGAIFFCDGVKKTVTGVFTMFVENGKE